MERLTISPEIRDLSEKASADIAGRLAEIDAVALENTEKVLSAFRSHRVSDSLFAGTTGYGYDDGGRDTLDRIYADIFRTEAALVRIDFANGTHAITNALFSAVKPGDTLMYATGAPYDTIHSAIGIEDCQPGSLRYYGINYTHTELTQSGKPDIPAIKAMAADNSITAVAIQRSRGYSDRAALTIDEIGSICSAVKEVNPKAAIIVDNCYGEFTELKEPTEVGADLVAGSLIKNPGGGLSPRGGYIAGRADLVEAAAFRLTVPGIGGEVGATLGNNRMLYQGLFMAPHTTAQALKTAVFCARLMELMGYDSFPAWDAPRSDIIQTVRLGSAERLSLFCRGIQSGAPVDSFVTPEPWDMPGYNCPVIMAAGAFIQGASIELSADGPMRKPYCAYLQGGLTYESGKLGVMLAADMLSGVK